ncbi:hypothetical protein SAMN05892883_1799 [Jatrophihabitans sp. GAS493]|uniref:hypothetical protein n=1 Tax=Jatrophihabitans sp. GAS493 TaxID=1907575 RepID=UPI000BC0076B|nr:hypothetical protein [Jatrophihabitans sp. GAS493]SOD72402.1 hypothetical protein SAMN05892883_1799 [Jatrophihabitans sp. GAS493]
MSAKSSSGSFEEIGFLVEGAVVGDGVAFGRLGDAIGDAMAQVKVDTATATAAGADVHVELGYLVNMYNHLSDLHTDLRQRYTTLHAKTRALAAKAPGGSAPGIKAAWVAIAKSTGGVGDSQATMLGNVQAVDHLIQGFMSAAYQNVVSYASQENLAIAELGKASMASGAAATAAQ